MSEIILHHYPQSPVTEKVRIGLGIKGLAWNSVQIPRIPPKPELMPLTGGYRRTPVMQIGADIYCDSQCILREIDRRHPDPTFLSRRRLRHALGTEPLDGRRAVQPDDPRGSRREAGRSCRRTFAADRARLYFGPDWDLQKVNSRPGPHPRPAARRIRLARPAARTRSRLHSGR